MLCTAHEQKWHLECGFLEERKLAEAGATKSALRDSSAFRCWRRVSDFCILNQADEFWFKEISPKSPSIASWFKSLASAPVRICRWINPQNPCEIKRIVEIQSWINEICISLETLRRPDQWSLTFKGNLTNPYTFGARISWETLWNGHHTPQAYHVPEFTSSVSPRWERICSSCDLQIQLKPNIKRKTENVESLKCIIISFIFPTITTTLFATWIQLQQLQCQAPHCCVFDQSD